MPPATPGSTDTPDTPEAAAKARFWDKIARKYAAGPVEDPAGYERTLARTRELLSPTQRVLEVGCGTGTTALHLAPSTGHMLATDVSPEMIAIAREKLAASPRPNLEFAVADADAPGFGQATYDVVLAFNLLHLVADLDAALSSLVAALEPGGVLVSKTACMGDMNPLITRLVIPVMRLFGKAPPVLCFDAAQLRAALTRHGLEVVALEYHGSKGKDARPFIIAKKIAT
ncbi:class I SAM-dependent methyltransferase [Nannocystaceae bacterium ST9]